MAQAKTSPPDCNQTIKDCNVALDKCDKAIKQQKAQIDLYAGALGSCTEANHNLRMDLQRAEESRNAWYRNPAFIGVLGILVGAVGLNYLRK